MSGLLRICTAGSVDDGKSTLIGRLLYDSRSVYEDQVSSVEKASKNRTAGPIDFSLFTDGLKAEREQGITIDVAYRYFAMARRKFILADTPGHEQYTRNMVTAASSANLAIILIDARKGVLTQTKRHSYLASLLNVPHVVLAVNKMDMVDYSQARFDEIVSEYKAFAAQLDLHDVHCIPLSALNGDMVVDRGENLDWYKGPAMLEFLEEVEIDHDVNTSDFRFPVQWVCRPQTDEHHDFRGFAGRIEAGEVSVGDEITILPSGRTTTVKEIVTYDCNLATAFAPQSVTLTLNDEIDISRGDMFVKTSAHPPKVEKEFEATLCWLAEAPLDKNRKYLVKHTTRTAKCLFSRLDYRVDVNTLEQHAVEKLNMNDIARVAIKIQSPLVFDSYDVDRATGSFIVIDEASNNTVAAGMIS